MKTVAYYRVSTKQQGDSGLGLEAQHAAVARHVDTNDCDILAEFVEVESGKKKDNERPQLAKALAHCKATGSTLVVAKLDRLARNVEFLSALMNADVPFICCDNPHATRLVLHILVAVAEAEAVAISERTKAALAAAKARGVLLGNDNPKCRGNLTEEGRKRGAILGAKSTQRKSNEFRAIVEPVARELAAGGMHMYDIAAEMNKRGYTTRYGHPWDYHSIRALLVFRDRSKK